MGKHFVRGRRRCLTDRLTDLDVLLRDEPRSVSQQLVQGLQAAQLGGRVLQAG